MTADEYKAAVEQDIKTNEGFIRWCPEEDGPIEEFLARRKKSKQEKQ